MIVTTAGRTNEEMIQTAKHISQDLGCMYIQRNKKSVLTLFKEYNQDVLVIGKNRYEWYRLNITEPIFFHPNTAGFRVKRWLKGEIEPFLEATELKEGMSFLDCTLGLASDSIMASLATGEKGKVWGIEGNEVLAYLVKKGLAAWESENSNVEEAMRRIKVLQGKHQDLLSTLQDKSFDVVYFDPMFDIEIQESNGIAPLRSIAVKDAFNKHILQEAIRVAKERVVLKDHWQSEKFAQFGFTVLERKTAKFHFGYIEC
ncbi:class I SAM-dependent methyltransferase [Sutcliffiella horikoshii]|uniref:class I SAM-dependent methyltransferase n=1 Tax=Sutcliffiella horikoshii TaxID=79883 RepID=UPI001CBD2D91|nr:class I SAM-dependent methyltransferase [Sutcliffiella horikoshii]UAL45670.1 class I SAM-dependent methyltransferase [Sutcliffiella horikoshii]